MLNGAIERAYLVLNSMQSKSITRHIFHLWLSIVIRSFGLSKINERTVTVEEKRFFLPPSQIVWKRQKCLLRNGIRFLVD